MSLSNAVEVAIQQMGAKPFGVRSPEGAAFLVQPADSPVPPAAFVAMACGAEDRTALNIMGGCSNMSRDDKARMLEYFGEAFEGIYHGTVFSGATRDVTPGTEPGSWLLDPMVTDLPGLIARINHGVVALGTCPKVADLMRFLDGRGLLVSGHGTFVNQDYDAIVVVQNGVENIGTWDQDLALRQATLRLLRTHAHVRTGGLGWNGGGVTQTELIQTVAAGDPLILCQGSGRKTDEIAGKFLAGDYDVFGLPDNAKPERVIVVDSRKPMTLRTALLDFGLARAA